MQSKNGVVMLLIVWYFCGFKILFIKQLQNNFVKKNQFFFFLSILRELAEQKYI